MEGPVPPWVFLQVGRGRRGGGAKPIIGGKPSDSSSEGRVNFTSCNQGFIVRVRPGSFETVDDPLGVITQVLGINDAKDLVGFYFDTNGVEHGFVAVPEAATSVPEPATLALFVFWVAGLGLVSRQRYAGLRRDLRRHSIHLHLTPDNIRACSVTVRPGRIVHCHRNHICAA